MRFMDKYSPHLPDLFKKIPEGLMEDEMKHHKKYSIYLAKLRKSVIRSRMENLSRQFQTNRTLKPFLSCL